MDLTLSRNERMEHQHEMKAHYSRLKKTRPTVNTRDPEHLARIASFKKYRNTGKSKKAKELAEANGKLVKNITQIACRQNKRAPNKKTLEFMDSRRKFAEFARKERQRKLDAENMQLAKRLLNRSSVYNKEEWKKDYKKFEGMMHHLSKAEHFIKAEKKSPTRTSLPACLQPLSPQVRNSQRAKINNNNRKSEERKRGKSAPVLKPLVLEKERKQIRKEGRPKCAPSGPGKKRKSGRLLRICVSGPPASGHDIISQSLSSEYGLQVITVGEIIAKELVKKTPFGQKAKKYVESRRLIPDKLIVDLVLTRLRKLEKSGWILNGFPKTSQQAEWMKEKGFALDVYLFISVDSKKIEERIAGRKFDPKTGTIYHESFYPAKEKAIKQRLVKRPQDTAKAIQTELKNLSLIEQAAQKGPFKKQVAKIISGSKRTAELVEEAKEIVAAAVKERRKKDSSATQASNESKQGSSVNAPIGTPDKLGDGAKGADDGESPGIPDTNKPEVLPNNREEGKGKAIVHGDGAGDNNDLSPALNEEQSVAAKGGAKEEGGDTNADEDTNVEDANNHSTGAGGEVGGEGKAADKEEEYDDGAFELEDEGDYSPFEN